VSTAEGVDSTTARRRWLALAAGLLGQASTTSFQFGVPFLLPQLRDAVGGSLSNAAMLVASPSIGLVLTLVGWGAIADRYGERLTMAVGLLGSAAFLVAAALSHSLLMLGVCMALAGGVGASVNVAGGRLLMGWFAPHQRGLAMGVRHMAQPLGIAVAALLLPRAAAAFGYHAALGIPAGFCLVIGMFTIFAIHRPPNAGDDIHSPKKSPYRQGDLWLVHVASGLLIVPQFTIAAFSLLYLVDVQAWPAADAGVLLAIAQAIGAAARLAAGRWSDRVADRLGPMRSLAATNAVIVGLLCSVAVTGSRLAPFVLAAASAITVSGNGLAFTAVAELAGLRWSGRALGAQNTLQNIIAIGVAPTFGKVISATGYASAFLLAALFAAVATVVVPRTQRRMTWGWRARKVG
jgi:sugar phosphate permease